MTKPPITIILSQDQVDLILKVLNEVPIAGLHVQQLAVATATMLQQKVHAANTAPVPEREVLVEDLGMGMTQNGGDRSKSKKPRKAMAGGQ